MSDQPKPRFKLTITVTKEYDVHVENYPESDSVEEMRKLDLECIQDDPLLFIDDPASEWDYQLEDITEPPEQPSQELGEL